MNILDDAPFGAVLLKNGHFLSRLSMFSHVVLELRGSFFFDLLFINNA